MGKIAEAANLPLSILVLVHELPPIGGGGGRVAFDLGKRLAERGHTIDIVTMGFRGLPRYEERDGMRIYRVPCLRRKAEISYTDEKITYVISAVPLVRRLIRQRRYDLIHCHFIVPAGLIAYVASGQIPYVITCHGSDVPGYNPDYYAREHKLMAPIWRRVVAKAGMLISPSNTLKKLIETSCSSTRVPSLRVIPYGFPVSRFARSKRENKILLVSRMLPRKGLQYFLQAIEGLKLDYEVHIVGDGPMRSELEELAKRTPTPVKFWGWLDNDSNELRELYESSSIFVFPSLSENFPVVLLEAMTAGLAIITSDIRGCPEVVGDTALLVPPQNAPAIREQVLRLASDRPLVAKLGDAARERVESLFDWPLVITQYECAFAEMVARS
jgi:glycosyltransferase involved in cell wall biosynthesis